MVYMLSRWSGVLKPKEKQQLRFELRKQSPLKYWKFSPNDAKVVDKWDIITNYKNQMFNKTSTRMSPWVIIISNDKKIGRLNAMRYVLDNIKYDNKDETKCHWYPEVVNILKYSTQVMRPDNTSENSFPSGHTAFAFNLAEVLHQEFKDKPLVYITGYTIATTVGAMRILNNRHWFTDVMVGAGIGMAATKLVYATHQYKWKMNNKGFLPIIGTNQAGFIYQF